MSEIIESVQIKIDYLQKELESVNLRLAEQLAINENYSNLINGRTDMKMLLSVMQQEQQVLKQQVHRLVVERDDFSSKCLLLEQILSITQQENKYILQEGEQRIKQLQDQVRMYEEAAKNEAKFDEKNPGYIVRTKLVHSVSEATLRLQQQVDLLSDQLLHQAKLINRLQESKDDLIQMNFLLSNEISRAKMQLLDKGSVEKYMSHLIEAQRRMLQLDRQDSERDILSPIENKVSFKEVKKDAQQKAGVPKLDLKRAQQIQQFNMQQINMKQQQNQHLNPSDELQKWVTEFKNLKNHYDAMKILNQQLQQQLDEQRRLLEEALSNNSILIRSNQQYEFKAHQLNQTLELYKKYQAEGRDLSRTQTKILRLQENSSLSLCQPQSSLEIKCSTEQKPNYKDKVFQLTRDVLSIFKRVKSSELENEERIPKVQEMKREIHSIIMPYPRKKA